MTYKYYLYSWRTKIDRMTTTDKEDLKILYHGLQQLAEEDRAILVDKYLNTNGKPHSDKDISKRYGLTHHQYTSKRGGIEAELDNIVRPLFKKLDDKRFNEVIDKSRRNTESMDLEQQFIGGRYITRLLPAKK